MGLGAVPARDEAEDALGQLLDRTERGMPEHTPRQDAEPNLDLVDPRGMLGRVDEMEAAAVAGVELLPPRAMVNVEVVPDDVDRPRWIALRDVLQKADQIRGFARGTAPAEHLARPGVV